MRKYVFLGFGLALLIGAATMFSTDASPIRHTSYSYGHDSTRTRHFSDRRGSFKYRRATRHQIRNGLRMPSPVHGGRTDVFYHQPYRTGYSTMPYEHQRAMYRLARPDLYPRFANTFMNGQTQVHRADYVGEGYAQKYGYSRAPHSQKKSPVRFIPVGSITNPNTYNASTQEADVQELYFGNAIEESFQIAHAGTGLMHDGSLQGQQIEGPDDAEVMGMTTQSQEENYVFDIPEAFAQDEQGVYRADDISLGFRISRSPEDFNCTPERFLMCAQTLGKDFREGQDMTETNFLQRTLGPKRNSGLQMAEMPTYIESFYAIGFGGKEYVYFVMNALDVSNGSVVRIEGVAKPKDLHASGQIMYRVFQSFHFPTSL